MIRTVILDAYGTVLSTGTGSVDAIARILSLNGKNELDPQKVYGRFKKIHETFKAEMTTFLTEAELCVLEMAQLKKEYRFVRNPADDAAILLSIQGMRIAFPDSKEAIERLQRSLRVAIGSNTDTEPLMTDLHRAGINPDRIFTSESLRVYKPSETFYEKILKELNAKPEETLFAGDSLVSDVLGPQRTGMKTCWIARKGKIRKENDPLPDYVAHDLTELANLLTQQ